MAKKMTLEDLAQMVQRGFRETATKQDLVSVRHDLASVKAELEERIRDLGRDVTRVERKVETLASADEVSRLTVRVERLEKKVGLSN